MKTEIIQVNDTDPSKEILIRQAAEQAGKILKNGGIVVFPTDTVYGLGAVYSDAAAVRKIFEAKGRPENKALSILVSDISQVRMLAENIPPEAEKLMQAFWPGALTLIFRKKQSARIPDEVTAKGDTIGIRMPDRELALRVIEEAGSPLAAPSANLSGKRSAASGSEAIDDLNGRVDMIIDEGKCPIGVSSTVLDMSGSGIRVIREGTVSRKMITEITGQEL